MNVVCDPALFFADEILCQTTQMTVAIARSKSLITQALSLRRRVFREEFAPRYAKRSCAASDPGSSTADQSDSVGYTHSPAGSLPQPVVLTPARDEDLFDPWCAHLVAIDNRSGRVVGTYRILTPEASRHLGCRYTEQEFWLTRLDPIRDKIVELGRACVDPNFRGGAALMLMWSGLARWLVGQPYTHLMGCVSLTLADGGRLARALYRQLMPEHDAGECFRVWPIHRLHPDPASARVEADAPGYVAESEPTEMPPLLRAYLRAGAQIMGEPCVDHDMHCVDFPVILPLDRLDVRFRQRFKALAA
jgi:putative hemolysin